MYKSNQFPIKDKTKPELMSTSERANFIFQNIEDKMPKLFEYIMNSKNSKS